MGLLAPIDDSPLGEVVWSQLDGDLVACENADIVLSHLARDMRCDHMAIFQLYPEGGVGQGFYDAPLHLYHVFFRHSAPDGYC